jgi:shikimate kinase
MNDETGHPSPDGIAGGHLILVGMMGSGKSTVGRLLAERSGWRYLDNDDLVRELSGREPSSIRAEDGEAALHDLESSAFAHAMAAPSPVIVGAAAGVIDDRDVGQRLPGDADVVWLRARPETLRARIGSGAGRRTEATDEAWLTRRAELREPAYRALADLVIDVDTLSPDKIVDVIMRWLATRDDGRPEASG